MITMFLFLLLFGGDKSKYSIPHETIVKIQDIEGVLNELVPVNPALEQDDIKAVYKDLANVYEPFISTEELKTRIDKLMKDWDELLKYESILSQEEYI